jgi:signal transduction histidine kinase
MTIKDIRPGEDVSELLTTVGRLPAGLDYAGIWRHRKKDGQCILVEVTTHAIEFRGRQSELVLANDVTARCEAEAKLRESRQQLRELADRLEAVREEERTRIAREVHDVLGQLLTGLKMDLGWIERRRVQMAEENLREAIGERVREATKLADALIGSVQQISSELRPSVLDNLGLPAAVGFEAKRFAQRTGLPCKVASLPDELILPADVATGAFRIFQEVLTNVARHAGAQSVQIRLQRAGGRAVLEVRDDGRGITEDQHSDPHALGLLGMRERARRMKGTLTIHGESGRGTVVRLEIPLEAGA